MDKTLIYFGIRDNDHVGRFEIYFHLTIGN